MYVDWPVNDLQQESLLLQHTFKVLLSQNRKAHNFVTLGCIDYIFKSVKVDGWCY